MPSRKQPGSEQDIDPSSPHTPDSRSGRMSVAAPAESRRPFPIVGIGASAGGLTGFEAFFSAMPRDVEMGMAFVLVQHLAPDHKSILADLVKRYTQMQVLEVTDGMVVQPNCTYIIPPNCNLALINGSLHLLEIDSSQGGVRLPIDFFFRTLAEEQGDRAICIVLSGTGSDGTQGLRAVKEAGGMVMAQTLESADYDGMPRSAIATGLVDSVLHPAEMPAQLIAYTNHVFGRNPQPFSAYSDKQTEALNKICAVLRVQIGHDFSQYKETTLIRRIERRMALHQIERIDDYVRFLQETAPEADALFRDLLIGVTNFFRDPDAFAVLESEVIPRLFAGKAAGSTVRIWVCGCSTGEEAYSIAILVQEHLDALRQPFKVNIFATDVDPYAIEQARTGLFPASIAADIPPDRLARYFSLEPGNGFYRIQKGIRDLLVFAEQNVTKDPPFSKLDLISCRNLLIYMNGAMQKRLIPIFHYALNRDGVLFLGSSETVGEFISHFSVLDRKWKIYQRRDEVEGLPRPSTGDFTPIALGHVDRSGPVQAEAKHAPARSWRTMTEQALLEHYAPVGILVNGRGEIKHIWGRTGQYLELAPGDAGMNILSMAREGLRRELVIALHKAATTLTSITYEGLRVRTNGDFITADLTVRPLHMENAPKPPDLFLVILEENHSSQPPPTPASSTGPTSLPEEDQIEDLERQLRAKEEYLQTALEEMETANEELRSTNEELQSVNEELQSTNEELETSKEELQSVNEELATVNMELQTKVADLSQANNDMNNLLAGTGVGTLFVDHQLHITRFTPATTKVINLRQGDIGRPVGHIVSNLVGYDRLVDDVQQVLDSLVPVEAEVQVNTGFWYLMRIHPYRTLENVIEGAVLTFVDITTLKRVEAALQTAQAQMSAQLMTQSGTRDQAKDSKESNE